jgi:Bacterial aa3 type cytochrome c oxidase subunit IV
MAQSGAQGQHGTMDIQDQRSTFHGFLAASLWGGVLIAQGLALCTLAFAIGSGWWSGMLALVVMGVAVGFLFRMSGAYWAVQVALWVLLSLGGAITIAFTGAG